MTAIAKIFSFFGKPIYEKKTDDFSKFNLISSLPKQSHFHEHKFISTISDNEKNNDKGLILNATIGCADDIVFQASQLNNVDLKAHDIQKRLKSAMMQSSMDSTTENAKYIIFTNNAYKHKYGNPNVVVLTNEHPNANPNITLTYDAYHCA